MTRKATWELIALVFSAIVVVYIALQLTEVARPGLVVGLAISSAALGGVTQTMLQGRKGGV